MRKLYKALLPVLIVAAGVLVALTLIRTRPQAARAPTPSLPTLVEVISVSSTTEFASVEAMGTVVAAQQVTLFPEVAGKVVRQSRHLSPGGRFKAGELLLQLDPRDYSLAAEQQESNVERAAFELEVERSRQRVAEREWQSLGEASGSEPDTLGRDVALRTPHLKNATAALAAAKSGLERAALNVERTRITAPFNGFIQEESVDVGQIVTPQTKLGVLIGSDEFWIQVSVPMDRLGLLAIPGVNAERGSEVRVIQETGSSPVERSGQVVRLMGDLDPAGRMARVLVSVVDPLGLSATAPADRLPLLLGAYVRAEIQGTQLEDVLVIPRAALQEQDRVYVMDARDQLTIKTVSVAYRRPSTVLVQSGLAPGDRVIVSRVPIVQEGMLLRAQDAAPGAAVPEVEAKGQPAGETR
jgi:RND family efflux transporter MFP subunit